MRAEASVIDAALDVIEQSRACVRENRRLLADTRYRIAASRRRLSPAFFSGGSADDSGGIHERVLARLLSGELAPLLEGECWAGIARGEQTCAVCGEPIEKEDAEYEVPNQGTESDFAHFACYLIWRHESRRLAAQNR